MSLGTTVRRVTSSTISFAILTALIKALPLTLADRSYDRVGPEVPTTADAPKPIPPISEDVEGINYTDVPPIGPSAKGNLYFAMAIMLAC
jgi:hypothetical protein